ncbi:MAG: PAS domain S-box protein [Candidatus Obscuribacterales bacterium]|nr:PAS domain S-box protein [Candidatus Obscuribacterales bacterium]
MENKKASSDLEAEIESLKAALAKEQELRLQAEAALSEEQRRINSVLDGLPVLVFIKDDKNNIVYLNIAAAESRGLPRDAMIGKSTYELYPDDAARYYEDDLAVIESNESRIGIVEQIQADSGEKRWVSTSKHPWRNAEGKNIGVLVTSSDITELVKQQSERDTLMSSVAKALESSEERYYLAINGSNDGVWDWNLLNNEVFYSPRYKEMLGYRNDEFDNNYEAFRSHVHPDDIANVEERVRLHLEEKVPYEAEFRMRHKNGETSWFSARGQAIWDKEGRPYRMAGSQRDITDRKQAEQNVNEFFSTVSHELRTPLSAVKGSLRLIEGGLAGQISNEARELLDIALSSCERLIRLVNDILDLRKIEAGKIDLKIRKVNSARLVDEVLQGLSSYADNHGVILETEAGSAIEMEADHDRLVQVMMNLVGNAIKFSGYGSKVIVKSETIDSDYARFSVRDNGPGIPENQQHLLFMKFKQLDASDTRRQDGTGLGLAICKAIVAQHHGKIGVQSKEGEGALFWFEIPFKAMRDKH